MDDSDVADVRLSASELYGAGQQIWSQKDRWNAHKRAEIDAFVTRSCLPLVKASGLILNAGSGGEGYDWLTARTVNSDLFFEQVRKLPLAVVSDVCRLPFAPGTFDLSVCVGSVLNYVSLLEGIGELSRTMKVGGHLVMHYESSGSFEQWRSPNRNQAVVRIETINSGRTDKIWIYSPVTAVTKLEREVTLAQSHRCLPNRGGALDTHAYKAAA